MVGQQKKMNKGAMNGMLSPVTYDKLGVRYRLWRDALEKRANNYPSANNN